MHRYYLLHTVSTSVNPYAWSQNVCSARVTSSHGQKPLWPPSVGNIRRFPLLSGNPKASPMPVPGPTTTIGFCEQVNLRTFKFQLFTYYLLYTSLVVYYHQYTQVKVLFLIIHYFWILTKFLYSINCYYVHYVVTIINLVLLQLNVASE